MSLSDKINFELDPISGCILLRDVRKFIKKLINISDMEAIDFLQITESGEYVNTKFSDFIKKQAGEKLI